MEEEVSTTSSVDEWEKIDGITGDESTPYESWKEYIQAVDDGEEILPKVPAVRKLPGLKKYEFNVDHALDTIDLSFGGYTPSRQAVEFFNIIRLVLGEDPEVDSSLMHYFLVDLIFGNVKREHYPYSKEIKDKIRINSRKIAIIASRGSAKALSLDSEVYTPSGVTTIAEVKVGDAVLDRDGKRCTVVGKSEVFNKPVYKMTLADGRVIKMSDDHDNIVWKRGRQYLGKDSTRRRADDTGFTDVNAGGMKEVVMTAKELYDAGVSIPREVTEKNPKGREHKFYIPAAGTLDSSFDYEEKEFGFDPYTTGVILGDGSTEVKTGYTRITSHISDIAEYDRNIPYEFGKMTAKKLEDQETTTYMFGLLHQGKSIKRWLGTERSYTKAVPEALKFGSMYQRLEVLKGLMDTDGTAYENGYCSFTSVSIQLAEDVQHLVRSLGGIAFITKSTTSSPWGVVYSVRIKINHIIFKLKRKASRQVIRQKNMKVGIESIELIESEPTQCISVSSDTKSFLTNGYTVTHNSTIVTAFLPIYVAVTGKIPNYGGVMFMVGFGDSQQAGAKVQANTIRDICEDSLFCKEYFEKMRFTDEECEFIRRGDEKVKKRAFMYKVKGAAGGSVRGIRYKTARPDCHVRGTIVTTELGTYPVEEHPYRSEGHFEDGLEVSVKGLTSREQVSTDHKYWTKECTNDQVWSKTEKRFVKDYREHDADWCKASKLTTRHWIGSHINMEVESVQAIPYKERVTNIVDRDSSGRILTSSSTTKVKSTVPTYFHSNDWWWLYGLWLGDGSIGKRSVSWTVANTQESTIGKKVVDILSSLGIAHSVQRFGAGCYTVHMSGDMITGWLRSHKGGNSIKNMPDWVLKLDLEKQKQILLGYIAADGYVDNKKVSQQVRINSVNLNVLKQLQVISSRLGLPTHIRNTKKAGKQLFNSTGRIHDVNHQWELRLVENVEEVLGIAVNASSKVRFKQVHISEGMLWRQFSSSKVVEGIELIPIECNNVELGAAVDDVHSYSTEFGVSKNCILFDDIIKNEADANSEVIMAKLKSMIYADAENALGGKKGKVIIINTPFNKRDPVYQALESGVWTPVCLPICEKIELGMSKEEYRGAWEEMHDYERVMERYEDAMGTDTLREFNQELMLRIADEGSKLIKKGQLRWIDRKPLEEQIANYNIYITTDYTASNSLKGDFSGTFVWAVSSGGDWFLLDLSLKKMGIAEQYEPVFEMVQKWGSKYGRQVTVGVEIDGQQQLNLFALEQLMRKKNIFFTFARQIGSDFGSKGISRRRSGGKKHEQFMRIHPLFQGEKIFFSEELRNTPDMKELLLELNYVTYEAITSTHDDGLDCVSMIGAMHVDLPAASWVETTPTKTHEMWGFEDEFEEEATGYGGYA